MDGAQHPETSADAIAAKIDLQRKSYLEEGVVTEATRKDRLKRAKACILENKDEFVRLVSEDFGTRSDDASVFSDVLPGVAALNDAMSHVGKWMRPSKRGLQFPLGLLGARAKVIPQPKGVVGLMTPWNFPMNMVFSPLAQMLAAGNRVIIKPSEATPLTSTFFKEAFGKYFDETEVAVVNGGVTTSQAFAQQKWDHLMFTGAPMVGKLIMRAASENLTPVTLELGGKSPVVIGKSADIDMAAERIATFKNLNAGQICLAPDYVNIDAERCEEFVDVYCSKVNAMYPTMLDNRQYTSIINDRHLDRLKGYIDDAKAKGADVRVINPAGEDFDGDNKTGKLPSVLIINPTDDMKVMQEEIFGPILPVRTYKDSDEVVDYVNDHERPLALYYFGTDKAEEAKFLSKTTSGGVTVNDILWHAAHEDLPFGGVGNSGIGRYHGHAGFLEFSHQKSVLRHPKLSIAKLLGVVPPYTKKLQRNVKMQLK